MTQLHIAVAEAAAPHFPISATLVMVVGFIAAVSIGSIAWYNSKRPPGWENKERPDIVPDIEK
ncbi:MAG: photosystem II assembly protein Psb35 [Nodosilinea sp.]